VNRDPKAAVRSYLKRAGVSSGDPLRLVPTDLDRAIAELPVDSGERHAWEEVRRLRARVILFLQQIDEADEGDAAVAFAARFHGEELASWLRLAEDEWPKAGSSTRRTVPGGTDVAPGAGE
jgi:hypothetical protein